MSKLNEILSEVKNYKEALAEMDKVAEGVESTSNVIKFLDLIDNGADIIEAANETRVIEMSTYELLNEISVIMKANK